MEHYQLRQKQSLPLEAKIVYTERKIREWYGHWKGKVYVAYSGGRDSTVLLHIVRSLYPKVPAVFCDTGIEFPELRKHVMVASNLEVIKPKYKYHEVIEKYGYPVMSKEVSHIIHEIRTTKSSYLRTKRLLELPKRCHPLLDAPFKISDHCCNIFKKYPSKIFKRKHDMHPFVGTRAEESRMRVLTYLRYGCSNYAGESPKSKPLSIWLYNDISEYIEKYALPIPSVYKDYRSTGCYPCLFAGIPTFLKLKETHPRLYSYCMDKLDYKSVILYMLLNITKGGKIKLL